MIVARLIQCMLLAWIASSGGNADAAEAKFCCLGINAEVACTVKCAELGIDQALTEGEFKLWGELAAGSFELQFHQLKNKDSRKIKTAPGEAVFIRVRLESDGLQAPRVPGIRSIPGVR